MSYGVKDYCDDLVTRLGQGWNRFWYTPSDPIAMCALRVCVGILSLIWFFGLGQDFQYLFGADGLLPPGTTLNADSWSFSLLDWAGDGTSLTIVFWIGMLVLLAFTIGLYTRLASLLSLGLVLSVLHRKVLLLSPFETVLVPILLYLCIAPTGATLSVDDWLRRKQGAGKSTAPRPGYATTIATRLLQIHLVAIYTIMVLAKLRVGMWWQGEAVRWMTGKPDTRIVDFTGLNVYLLNAWTYAIVLFEGTFALLIWNKLARPLLLAISVLMWGSLCLITGDVLFSLLMIVAGFAFVSPAWLRASCSRCEASVAERV